MKPLLKLILGLYFSLISIEGFAQGKNAVYGGLGFTEGGASLGADYEYLGLSEFGVGGYARMYSKDKDRSAAGVMAIGGFIRPHFNKKSWDMYMSPGFAILQIDGTSKPPGDATTLGPSLAIGLMYDINANVALGIENMRQWVWFDDDYRGSLINDFMLRFRGSF